MEKKCFKCNAVKPLEDFYPHKQMKDGHLNKCKECNKVDTKRRLVSLVDDLDFRDSERKRGEINTTGFTRGQARQGRKLIRGG